VHFNSRAAVPFVEPPHQLSPALLVSVQANAKTEKAAKKARAFPQRKYALKA